MDYSTATRTYFTGVREKQTLIRELMFGLKTFDSTNSVRQVLNLCH